MDVHVTLCAIHGKSLHRFLQYYNHFVMKACIVQHDSQFAMNEMLQTTEVHDSRINTDLPVNVGLELSSSGSIHSKK